MKTISLNAVRNAKWAYCHQRTQGVVAPDAYARGMRISAVSDHERCHWVDSKNSYQIHGLAH
jgi:hypothetical protein